MKVKAAELMQKENFISHYMELRSYCVLKNDWCACRNTRYNSLSNNDALGVGAMNKLAMHLHEDLGKVDRSNGWTFLKIFLKVGI